MRPPRSSAEDCGGQRVDERLPPQSLSAEGSLIGSLLADASIFDDVAGIVREQYFYSPDNQRLFGAIVGLAYKSAPINKVSLVEALSSRGVDVGAELLGLIGSYMTAAIPDYGSCKYFARLIREKAALRALVAVGTKIAELGYDGDPIRLRHIEKLGGL